MPTLNITSLFIIILANITGDPWAFVQNDRRSSNLTTEPRQKHHQLQPRLLSSVFTVQISFTVILPSFSVSTHFLTLFKNLIDEGLQNIFLICIICLHYLIAFNRSVNKMQKCMHKNANQDHLFGVMIEVQIALLIMILISTHLICHQLNYQRDFSTKNHLKIVAIQVEKMSVKLYKNPTNLTTCVFEGVERSIWGS